jgi:RNA polymerase sigma factor (sigma-70 family)
LRGSDDVKAAAGTFEEFFRIEYPRLAKAILLVTGDASEAEDLVQEAMARVLERWERVQGMQFPAAYVYRVAVNLHRRRLRRRVREPIAPSEGGSPPDPADLAVSGDTVLRTLRSLSPDQRAALVLVEWLDLSPEQAGRVLGIKPASVRGRLHRARRTLQERLGGGNRD